jgi:hypothetical protein
MTHVVAIDAVANDAVSLSFNPRLEQTMFSQNIRVDGNIFEEQLFILTI